MRCEDIDRFLDTPGLGLPPEAAEHLRECERCRRLVQVLQAELPAPAVPVNLQARIQQTLRSDLKSTKPIWPSAFFTAMFLGIVGLLGAAMVLQGGARGLRALTPIQWGVVATILLAGAAFLAVSLSRQMVPGGRLIVRPGVLLFGVVAAMALAVGVLYPWKVEGPFVEWGAACTIPGALFALPPGFVFLLILRRGAVLSPGSLGASAGFLAGLAGAIGLHLQCWVVEAPHVLVWHLPVPVIGAGLGYLIGRAAGSRRRFRR